MGYCDHSSTVKMSRQQRGEYVHLCTNSNRIMPSESKLGPVVNFDGLRIEFMKTKIYFVRVCSILGQLFYPPIPHSSASIGYYLQYRSP